MSSDIVAALGPVVDVFDDLCVAYSVSGSVASSAHGIARSTLDVDVVADLRLADVDQLMRGEVSERQWSDVVGVLKVQSGALDLDYLRTWAATLDIIELLERAITESGR